LSILRAASISPGRQPQRPAADPGAAAVGLELRDRLIATCTSIAATGARIATSTPTMPSGLRGLPKNNAKLASMPTAPAIVAVTVMISVSRLRTWASSCAITPAISSRLRRSSRPVVAATAAFSGLRPVAKAFGWSLSIR
jgi:hypothetical protein